MRREVTVTFTTAELEFDSEHYATVSQVLEFIEDHGNVAEVKDVYVSEPLTGDEPDAKVETNNVFIDLPDSLDPKVVEALQRAARAASNFAGRR